jgi:RNA exonuclease 1
MFSSALFKKIPCPYGPEKCKLANCLFSHEHKVTPLAHHGDTTKSQGSSVGEEHSDLKRRKLGGASMERIRAEPEETMAASKITGVAAQESAAPNRRPPKLLPSSVRPISPPPTAQQKKTASATQTSNANGTKVSTTILTKKSEGLVPRITKNSAPFIMRNSYLTMLHAEFVRLNDEVKKSKDESISSLKLSDNELICMALNQEEDVAKKGSGMYKGLMGNKFGYYRKQKLDGWVSDRQKDAEKAAAAANGAATETSDAPLKIETGLSHAQELDMLDRFILSPKQMSQAGFILTAPTDAQIVDAKKTIESSGGYETCDRCGTRFQFLEQPKDDGSMTTNGKCTYHWGRPIFPKREKTDLITGSKEAMYLCCNQPKGTPGCSTMASHVFKINPSNVGRLASILQFQTTPLNTKAERTAIAFDCEMGYTTAGLEMIRLSACTWPSNEALIDVLVKPMGKILDLNTKFSGVTPRQFRDAIEYDAEKHTPLTESVKDTTKPREMKIVSSPVAARTLLTSYISPNTVLIGHAIDNDLNVLRLLHYTIVDTSLLYPHHGGLPYRFPLRKLAKDFLNLDIQTAGAAGHDSMEDSRATGDLVRFKIMKEWKFLAAQGWSVKEGKWYATIGGESKAATLPPYTGNQGWSKKRKADDSPRTGQVGETVGLATLLKEKADTAN